MGSTAAVRLRTQVRDEYRFRQRQFGWRYVPSILVYCSFFAVMIVFYVWWIGPSAGWFTAGVGTGLSLLFMWAIINSDEAARLTSAAIGEEWVASELSKLEKRGWHTFNNVSFNGWDVDHVVIGPVGVVVVETKSSSEGWDGQLSKVRQSIIARAERQVRRAKHPIETVLRQNGSDAEVVGVMIAACGPGRPGECTWTPDRVRVVPADLLQQFLLDCPRRLDTEQVESARFAMEKFVTDRTEYDRRPQRSVRGVT